ncbi:MAG: acetyl-CoA carboxylase biotin carboxyl carrier protein subunit [Bacteroidales bacterium]|jgi:biotin carboxyl carrier protein|nr:acetyl-CoA carboxylase biotin carboxyl carrier protein subunit [Lentimicrobiaceae bacterium]MDG1135812.1 acetyl-CoA carboxylase biotin carboxyl carrier protein subunit [Bacteroidales bacterium]MDG1902287.1 acetyl-CoA carboxylase biotin carboxyl carrier protein subunit [Bacteroidales bacterium]MDG2081267.1 acetyl-CoA carboxylase biotin carboxyl carrier protein subunit [Bacteroidales bacterium]|tara:strand:+ start:3291 stop:3614 length:324 start_codon:yes stop_codon:yes gene_type:complete
MAKEVKKPRYSSIEIGGVKYKTYLTEKYKRRTNYSEHEPSKVIAFIPGTVKEIYFKNKRKVKEGDIILILDAMKMMNSVAAPMDGELRLKAKAGDIVSKNQLLFEII